MTPWRSIFRGAITRFAPGVLAFFGSSFVVAAALKGIEIGPAQVAGFAGLALSLTVGYAITIGLLRPSLEAAAGVEGRRSFLAGLGSTVIFLGLSTMQDGPTASVALNGLALLAGSVTTFVTFFPWLRRVEREAHAFERELDNLASHQLRNGDMPLDEVRTPDRDRVV